MMQADEVIAWIIDAQVRAQSAIVGIGVDEGGLSLLVEGSDAYLEIGGMPEEDGDDGKA